MSRLVNNLAFLKNRQMAESCIENGHELIPAAKSDGFHFSSGNLRYDLDLDHRFQKTSNLDSKKQDLTNSIRVSDMEAPHYFSESSIMISSRSDERKEVNPLYVGGQEIASSRSRDLPMKMVDPETGLIITENPTKRNKNG
jgi:IQ calmodulin-binding motif